MAVTPIKTIPDPILRKKSTKVTEINDEIKKVIKNLKDTVVEERDPEGAGLAAPQIGVSKQICVVRKFEFDPENPEEEKVTDHILINPKIIKASKEKEIGIEGCLSVPDIYGHVERPKKIKMTALDEAGEEIQINASGFFARAIQHEIDHLNGILFIDKVIGETVKGEQLDSFYEKSAI